MRHVVKDLTSLLKMGTQDSIGLSFTVWKQGIWIGDGQVSFTAVCWLLLDMF